MKLPSLIFCAEVEDILTGVRSAGSLFVSEVVTSFTLTQKPPVSLATPSRVI